MYLYSIMPLDVEHADEICEDIKKQYETGVATCVLFKMTLVPEGDPPADKAGIMSEKFDIFRDKLAAMGISSGILVQASIGHGYKLDKMFPFQRYTNLTDGGLENVCCPYDEKFREHFKGVMRTLAEHKPAEIMVDDDFRLIFRGGRGCACPLHMAAFNKKAGLNLTREELLRHTEGTGEEDIRITNIFAETQRESMILAAKAMREGIDEVDPKLRGSFCACGPGAEFAAEIGGILAGEGNAAVIRINNGMYSHPGPRGLSDASFRAATQITVINGEAAQKGIKIDAILAETDTCPQNRYSTAAQFLHSHFTATILEGVKGAKHWITRLSAYEPISGKAYRKILSKNRGFYEKLSEMAPEIKWQGTKIPMSKRPAFGYATSPIGTGEGGWQYCTLERLGIPMYFSAEEGGAVFMDGAADSRFTDDEMREMFKGVVVLAGETAMRLQARGFGEYMGVKIEAWKGENVSGEILHLSGKDVSAQLNSRKITPLKKDDNFIEMSYAYHIPDGKTKKYLFPASTMFTNPAGGTTIVFCGTPKAELLHTIGFSFLNASRKEQFVWMLSKLGCLPVYYPEDAEVYLKTGLLPGGERIVAVFNLGLDPLEELPLVFDSHEAAIKSVSRITSDGKYESCDFSDTSLEGEKGDIQGTVFVKVPVNTMDPVILIVK
ncbi:MAG: hypothetical protein J6A50_06050 [Clostridia bacterium]|nr:hypothetical protein [Clostridia bacterium]